MRLTVDPHAAEPPYEQVRRQLAEQVESGELAAGDRLPPVRRLADELGLAANTVARAYRELELSGVIQTRGRAGSFVAGAGVEREARAAADTFAARMIELGVGRDEALALVAARLEL